jgi:hypothetical protein
MITRDIPTVLGDMLQGLNEAAACCSGMIHTRPDSSWFFLRDVTEAIRAMITSEIVDPMMANKNVL